MGAAFRADQLLPRRHPKGGLLLMAVGTAVVCQSGVHQAQAVEQLRPGSKGAPNARHSRPLMERQGGRYIQHLVHLSLGCLGHPPSRVGGQGLQVTAGALCIQNA